jgi:hypothetical protein
MDVWWEFLVGFPLTPARDRLQTSNFSIHVISTWTSKKFLLCLELASNTVSKNCWTKKCLFEAAFGEPFLWIVCFLSTPMTIKLVLSHSQAHVRVSDADKPFFPCIHTD